MKLPSFVRACSLALAVGCFGARALHADDTTPPVVAKPISDVTVTANSAPTVINVKKTFALSGVTGSKVVRFSTSLGNMDVFLDAANYPLNVANFLAYVNSGAYSNTFIHRSIASFIFQGGGYYVSGDKNYPHITVNGAVTGEHKDSNVRGTIALALTGGADSADSGTSEWFLNLVDNTALDTYANNQGPFTAFGHVIEGDLATMDAIGNVPTYNASNVVVSSDAGVFTDLPLINFDDTTGSVDIDPDLVYIKSVALIPLTPKAEGDTALLALKVKDNTNPGLVTATFDASKLTLTYAAGGTGVATITVMAKNPVTKSRVKTTFNVTVE